MKRPVGRPKGAYRKNVSFRLRPELMEEIRELANLNVRSLNMQIEFILEQAMDKSNSRKRAS